MKYFSSSCSFKDCTCSASCALVSGRARQILEGCLLSQKRGVRSIDVSYFVIPKMWFMFYKALTSTAVCLQWGFSCWYLFKLEVFKNTSYSSGLWHWDCESCRENLSPKNASNILLHASPLLDRGETSGSAASGHRAQFTKSAEICGNSPEKSFIFSLRERLVLLQYLVKAWVWERPKRGSHWASLVPERIPRQIHMLQEILNLWALLLFRYQ